MQTPVVVIPNLNGGVHLIEALKSLEAQSLKPKIIVVDNASTDGSAQQAAALFPGLEIIWHDTNRGYAGGVNPGFRRALDIGAAYVAPFNDDAVADKFWLERLVRFMHDNPQAAAVAPKLLHEDRKHVDSAGECYTTWGLAYPRGRGEIDHGQYDHAVEIFAATGASSLYRVDALNTCGLLDEDFFAYYEDVDLSFRLRLLGWKIWYEPSAVVYHKIGMTSSRVKGFTTEQTIKNLPMLAYRNIPDMYLSHVLLRLRFSLVFFVLNAIFKGNGISALRGLITFIRLKHSVLNERRHIQSTRVVSDDYIWSLLTHDLPPNAHNLRRLRGIWWKLTRRKTS